MATKNLRFAIFGSIHKAENAVATRRLLSCLRGYGDAVVVDRKYYDYLAKFADIDLDGVEVFTGTDFSADFVMSMGGDGTFLKAASRVCDKGIPVLGVNTGRLGFLADTGSDEIEECIAQLHRGEYTLEPRKTIQVEVENATLGGSPFALNDVAILKGDDASMITIHAEVNGEHFTTYRADGLIVSTPTGSTAYSLSNGGPIIVPGTSVFLVTAVAPHSLNMRPIVIHDDVVLTFEVESRRHSFLIAVDGRTDRFSEGARMTMRKSPYKINIVKRNGKTYAQTLREKMMWGSDGRG